MLKWLKTTIEVYYVNLLKMNINKSLNLKFHRELTLNSLKIITFTIEKAILLIGFIVNYLSTCLINSH